LNIVLESRGKRLLETIIHRILNGRMIDRRQTCTKQVRENHGKQVGMFCTNPESNTAYTRCDKVTDSDPDFSSFHLSVA